MALDRSHAALALIALRAAGGALSGPGARSQTR